MRARRSTRSSPKPCTSKRRSIPWTLSTTTSTEKAKIVERLRALCLSFPETNERLSHGTPTFFIRDKSSFVMLWNDHHGDGRFAIWCAAPPGAQEALVAAEPERFFRPPYVGHRGWIGVRMETPDWKRLPAIVEDAYRRMAPRKLLARLNEPAS